MTDSKPKDTEVSEEELGKVSGGSGNSLKVPKSCPKCHSTNIYTTVNGHSYTLKCNNPGCGFEISASVM